MKRKKGFTVLSIVLLLSMLFVSTVSAMPEEKPLACHFEEIKVDESVCDQATILAKFVGPGLKKIELFVDGGYIDSAVHGGGFVKIKKTVEDLAAGPHTTFAKVYKWTRIGFLNWDWVLQATSPTKPFVVEACYCLCDETIAQDKVYGEAYDVGEPIWGEWVENPDGSFTKTGIQATAVDWTQKIVDKYDPNHTCDTLTGTEPGEDREVTETTTASCDVTVPQEKVYGESYDVGEPIWGEWVENPDGSFTKTGVQATAVDWTQEYRDSEFPTHVCSIGEGTDPGTREVSETREGLSEIKEFATCWQAWAYEVFYNPAGEEIDRSDVEYYVYSDPLDPNEIAYLMGIEIPKPDGCLGSESYLDLSNCDEAHVCYIVKDVLGIEASRECDTYTWQIENFLEVAELFLNGEIVLWPERAECEPCIPQRTGEWMHFFRRLGSDHDNWTTICQLKAPKGHVYTEEELATKCAYDCEPLTWELGKRLGEKMIFSNPCTNVKTAGNWYDTSCEVFGLCEWLDSLKE